MNRFALIALALTLGCISGTDGGPSGKSIFALNEDDFQTRRDELATTTAPTCGGSCLTVEKGDIILLKASGQMKTTFGTVGPEGSDTWGGVPFSFVNRRAFGVFARINHNVFFVGRELAVIAPESGDLEVVVNGCTNTPPFTIDCNTTGGFNVQIHSKLKQGVTLATTPSITDNSVVKSTTFSVNPALDWQQTGVTLKKGQKVRIAATGSFTGTGFSGGAVGPITADGVASMAGTCCAMMGRFIDRLYGRVDGNIVELGAHAAFLSPADGQLELSINHVNPADETGSLSVVIEEGLVPARGLFESEVASFAQKEQLTVPSDGLWKATAVNVKKGDPIFFSATGNLTGGDVETGTVGPWGEGSVSGPPAPLVNRPRLGLFGRVGTEAFFVGAENAVLAPADGVVELVVNQFPNCAVNGPQGFCDVQGSFSVDVIAP